MKNFNFAAPKVYRDIFKPGKIYDLYQEIMSGAKRNTYVGFTLSEFSKVPKLFATYDPRERHLLDIPDEEELTTADATILGLDLKCLALLMYQKPRTAYVEFGKDSQVRKSLYSGAVPYPLLGFKNFHGISYDTWNKKYASLDPKTFELKEKEGDLESTFKIDLMLGKTFASTKYNLDTDTIEWTSAPGLLLLSTLNIEPTPDDIAYFRAAGLGKYRGHFSTVYGSVKVKPQEGISKPMLELYNKASAPMRLMLAQRWVWYGKHRNDDMITDFNNWNNLVKTQDTAENMFVGLEPKKLTGMAEKFGIGIKR